MSNAARTAAAQALGCVRFDPNDPRCQPWDGRRIVSGSASLSLGTARCPIPIGCLPSASGMLRRSGWNTCPRPDGDEDIDDVSRIHRALPSNATITGPHVSEALPERQAPTHGDGANRDDPSTAVSLWRQKSCG
jgi:hypothetical protein